MLRVDCQSLHGRSCQEAKAKMITIIIINTINKIIMIFTIITIRGDRQEAKAKSTFCIRGNRAGKLKPKEEKWQML